MPIDTDSTPEEKREVLVLCPAYKACGFNGCVHKYPHFATHVNEACLTVTCGVHNSICVPLYKIGGLKI